MPKFELKNITGVMPALVTPFDENEKFDEKRMRGIINFLIDRGVDGFYITGSTGEAFLMSPEERKRVLEVVVDETAGRLPVIAHIGAIGTHTSVDLAEHAQENGVDALSSVPPFYWPFTSNMIQNYYTDLTKSTDLPMIIYNIPLVGLMGFEQIMNLSSIKGVGGIKYTAPTQFDFLRIKEEIGPDFMVYSGTDEMAMSGLMYGADGLIGSFYNMIPEVIIELCKAVKENDMSKAKHLQEVVNKIIFFGIANKGVSFIKRAMAWQGADAGYCRKPFDNFTSNEEAELKEKCRQLMQNHKLEGVAFLDAI
ncbi:MAG: N-acetylneuraminate lyase [Rhizobiales bacterium]|nr:N-acetylneuraminate lyase [Hyphomicrobiales bacterium]NRB14297.1 N-acetylneuraminate lyase [Hyphomicrobiales bacterium]